MQKSSCEEVFRCTDILWEILLRLPLKFLLPLKCVSKSWLTLISDHRFRESHFLHHHPCPTSLIFSRSPPLTSLILPFAATTPTLGALNLDFLNQSRVTVLHSCNGFLLCRSGLAYFVCNPITGDFTALTWRNYRFKPSIFTNLYLAFDPSISPHCKIISVAQDYLINNLITTEKWVFNEYNFKTRSWISPGVSFRINFSNCDAFNGVYCNGAIHWCREAEFSMYFEVDTMRFIEHWRMPLSSSEWRKRHITYFGEAGGRLYLVVTLAEQSYKYDVFEMNVDYCGWSLRHCVDVNPLRFMYKDSNWSFTIVRPVKQEKSMLVLIATEETLVLHDPLTSRKVCEIEMGMAAGHIRRSLRLGYEIFPYFENTAPFVEACTHKLDSSTSRLQCCQIL